MEYQRDMAPPPASLGFSPAQVNAMDSERRTHVLPRYVEREVLIIGVAVAAWLVVNRRRP
jgi:hypothetical protein